MTAAISRTYFHFTATQPFCGSAINAYCALAQIVTASVRNCLPYHFVISEAALLRIGEASSTSA